MFAYAPGSPFFFWPLSLSLSRCHLCPRSDIATPQKKKKARDSRDEEGATSSYLQKEGEKLKVFYRQEKDALVAKALATDDIPDITAEEGLYSELLSRISADVSKILPGHSEVLQSVLEWYVDAPVDRLMQARKERWRRPHSEAFEMLETEVYNSQKLAESSQGAERRIRAENKELQRALDALNEKYRESLNDIDRLNSELNGSLTSSGVHAQEARVLRELTTSQGKSLVQSRSEMEKALKDVIKEQKARKSWEDEAKIMQDTITRLENEIVKLRPQTPNRDSVRRYRKRNREIVESIKVVQEEQRKTSRMQAEEKERASDMMALLEIDQKSAYGRKDKDQTEYLFAIESFAHNLKDYSEQAAIAERDRTVSMAKVGELISLLQNADPFSDSDSDEDAPNVEEPEDDEEIIQDPALLRIKCKGLEQHLQLKDEEIRVKIGEADTIKREVAMIQNIRQVIEESHNKVKDELSKLQVESKKKQADLQKKIDEIGMKNSEIGAKLEIKTKEVAELLREKKISEAQMSTLNLEAGAYKTKLESLEINLKDMALFVEQAKAEKAEMESRMAELQSAAGDGEMKIYEATQAKAQALSQAEEAKAQVAQLQSVNEELSAERKELQAAKVALSQEVSNLKRASQMASTSESGSLSKAKEEIARLTALVAHLQAPGGGGGDGSGGASGRGASTETGAHNSMHSAMTSLSRMGGSQHDMVPGAPGGSSSSPSRASALKSRLRRAFTGSLFALKWASSIEKIRMPDVSPDIDNVINEETSALASQGDEEAMALMFLANQVAQLSKSSNESQEQDQGRKSADQNASMSSDAQSVVTPSGVSEVAEPATAIEDSGKPAEDGPATLLEYVKNDSFSKSVKRSLAMGKLFATLKQKHETASPVMENVITQELIDRADKGDERAVMMICLQQEVLRLQPDHEDDIDNLDVIDGEAQYAGEDQYAVNGQTPKTGVCSTSKLLAGSTGKYVSDDELFGEDDDNDVDKGGRPLTLTSQGSFRGFIPLASQASMRGFTYEAEGPMRSMTSSRGLKGEEIITSPPRKRSSVWDARVERIERRMATPHSAEVQKTSLIGPWVPPTGKPTDGGAKAMDTDGVGELLVSSQHLMELAREDVGGHRSISERILLFRAAANARFRKISRGDMNALVAPGVIAKALLSHGFSRDEAKELIPCMMNEERQHIDAESFVRGIVQSKAVALYRLMDAGDKNNVDTATAVGMLMELGYSETDCAEFAARADAQGNGVISEFEWVQTFFRYLTPAMASLPRSLPAVGGVALAGSRRASLGKSKRAPRHSVPAAAPQSPSADGKRNEIETGVAASSECVSAGEVSVAPVQGEGISRSWTLSFKEVKPTPIGLMLEAKESLISKLEKEREQLRSEISSLWTFVKESINQHSVDRTRLKEQIDAQILHAQQIMFRDQRDASTVISPGDLPGDPAQGNTPNDKSIVFVHDHATNAMTGSSIVLPQSSRIIKLDEILEGNDSLSSRKPRTLIWLMKTIYTILDEKVLSDSVELQHGSRPQDFSPFLLTFFKKRFGLGSLVRQNIWDFKNTLEGMPSVNTLVRLVHGMCHASFSIGQQSSMIEAWGILAVANGDQNNKEGPQPRKIPTSHAIEVCHQVLPYSTLEQRKRVELKIQSMESEDGVDEYSILDVIVGALLCTAAWLSPPISGLSIHLPGTFCDFNPDLTSCSPIHTDERGEIQKDFLLNVQEQFHLMDG